MANIGKIAVQLSASTGQFIQGMTQASGVLSRFSRANARFTKNPFKFLGGAAMGGAMFALQKIQQLFRGVVIGATAAGATFALLTRRGLSMGDALGDAAEKLGVSTSALAKLRYAASFADVEAEALDSSIQKLVKNTSDAASGTGAAADAYKELGINAKALNSLSADEQFLQIAGAMEKITNKNDKLRLTLAIFGKGGGGIVGVLNQGAAGIAQMNREAEMLGVALSAVQVEKMAEANDGIAKLGVAFDGFFQQMAAKFAPFITSATDKIIGWIESMGGIPQIATDAFNAFGKAADNAIVFAINRLGEFIDASKVVAIAMNIIKITIMEAFIAPLQAVDYLQKKLGTFGKVLTWSPLRNLLIDDKDVGPTVESFNKDIKDTFGTIDKLKKFEPGKAFKAFAFEKKDNVTSWVKSVAAADDERLTTNQGIASAMEDQVDAAKALETSSFGVGNPFLTALSGPAFNNPIAAAAKATPGVGKDATATEVQKGNSILQQIANNTARPMPAVAV